MVPIEELLDRMALGQCAADATDNVGRPLSITYLAFGSNELQAGGRVFPRCDAALFAETVVPDLFYIVPVGHDAIISWVLLFGLRGNSARRTRCSSGATRRYL